MADQLTFAAFVGSLRAKSFNRMLLNAVVKAAPSDVRVDVIDVHDIPLYNMDIDGDKSPEPVKRLRERIKAADGLIIVTPEHNYAMSGVTKTVIEWASRPPDDPSLDLKPAAVMGAATGGFGTVRAQANVRQTAPETGMLFLQDPEIRVSFVSKKFNEAGELTDEDLKKQLGEFWTAMIAWTRKMGVKPG
jgi:chromate reductase, NAD(P)H dehydrogenase (quinone)